MGELGTVVKVGEIGTLSRECVREFVEEGQQQPAGQQQNSNGRIGQSQEFLLREGVVTRIPVCGLRQPTGHGYCPLPASP
jgi:hypothetical protein